MAPYSFGVSLLTKSFSLLTCRSSLARCTTILPSTYFSPVRCLTSETSCPPKRPLNGYMRYLQQQKPVVTSQNPEIKSVELVRKIAQQWRSMSPEQKQPFQEAFFRAMEQFKVDKKRFQAQLTPAQLQQQAQEKRQRRAKRSTIRKKRELTNLGKPKRPRTSFNVFMSEHYEEAKGATSKAKMMSLLEDWRNLLSHQKQVYAQLAEDDKIRYKNEMKSWEEHMVEIGREDLIREETLSVKKKAAKKAAAATKEVKGSAKAETKKTASAKGTAKSAKKTTKSRSAKTVSPASKKK